MSWATLSEMLEPPHLASLLTPTISQKKNFCICLEFHMILCLEVVCITEWVYLKQGQLSARSPVAADTYCSLPSAFCAAC